MPNRSIGLVNVIFLGKINALYAGSGPGGEGKARGARQLALSMGPEWMENSLP